MIEIADISPDIAVPPAEYHRLLGYPRGHALQDRAAELAGWARGWYAEHGRPWVYARYIEGPQVGANVVLLEDAQFHGERLRKTLQASGAHGVIIAAMSAGPDLEERAQELWREEKPDEYFFLETWGSAVVEHLIAATGARLCAWAEGEQMAVLPHYSPGYSEWDIAEQPRLFQLVGMTREQAQPGRMEVLDSGALRPKKSQLAVFGLTRHTERVRRLTGLVPCEECLLSSCRYRRARYGGRP
jgi:hypothetical protein